MEVKRGDRAKVYGSNAALKGMPVDGFTRFSIEAGSDGGVMLPGPLGAAIE